MALLGQHNPSTYRMNNIFHATAGQTIFYCHYDPTTIDVYQNGAKLTPVYDYVATNGISVTLNEGCIDTDVIEIIAFKVNVHHAEFTNAPISIGANTNLIAGHHYSYTISCTMALPSNPLPHWRIRLYNNSGTKTAVIGRNGSLIQGIDEDVIIDIEGTTVTLVYLNDTVGWWVE